MENLNSLYATNDRNYKIKCNTSKKNKGISAITTNNINNIEVNKRDTMGIITAGLLLILSMFSIEMSHIITATSYAADTAVSHAQSAGGGPENPSLLMSMTPMILIMAVFYFLIIRPQNKKMKEHRNMINNIKVGDNIVTNSGIFGIVSKAKDDYFMIEICNNVEVKIRRDAVMSLVKNEDRQSNNLSNKAKKKEDKRKEKFDKKKKNNDMSEEKSKLSNDNDDGLSDDDRQNQQQIDNSINHAEKDA